MKIADINLKIIQDSRGKETLEAELFSGDFFAKASVPAGKSTGKHEAFVLEPKKAIEKFEDVRNEILERDFDNQEEFDNFLISLDGTPNKSNLGANLILALSLSFARLKAKNEEKELFQYINQQSAISNQQLKLPKPIFNVINGGSHATNKESKLEFQEFQIIPETDDFNMAFSLGKIFYRKLGDYLRQKFGAENVVLGDEAGYSAPFKSNEEALESVADVIEKYNYPIRIGLDVAASQFYVPAEDLAKEGKEGYYLIDSKKYSTEELREYYLKLIDTYNILSIEDPFYEEDFDDFTELLAALNKKDNLVITDDLTTTNLERLNIAINKKSGNAILIKLNQIGSLTETLKVIKLAYENNWQAIVSHRSGETMDDFIADLAVGVGTWGIKAGAPGKPERLAKYERVLEILNLQQKF